MATISTALPHRLTRPAADADYQSKSGHVTLGVWLGLIGLALATVTLIANLAVGGSEDAASTLAWSFGLTTTAFASAKVGIAVVLIGILVRLWLRVDSVKSSLPRLKAEARDDAAAEHGTIRTAFGRATVTSGEPKPLFIHRMAQTMWAPMVAMGAMAVVAGLIISFFWAGRAASGENVTAVAAWTQGLQFLGEAMLLGGISFLLGTILASLREGGGQVQASLDVPVKTLKMPTTAKLFVVLMMSGMMVAIAQFVLYLWVATLSDPVQVTANFAWLGPFRELSLGLLLSGIVLALATIAKVLGFQFWRIRQIVETGA